MRRAFLFALGLAVALQGAAAAIHAAPNAEWRRKHRPKPPAERLALIDPAKPGELRLRATFCSASVCFGAVTPVEGIALQYRARGTVGWTAARTPSYFAESHDYRGSVVNLAEDTDYEIRLVDGAGKALAEGSVRTWASEVPVARTVIVDPATAKFPLTIADRGTPDGWIRYTAKPGTVLTRDNRDAFFKVDGAAYVLLDNLRLAGGGGAGGGYPISVKNARYVRIRNCEISGWGRTGKVDFTKLARTCTEKGKPINMDGAIHVGKGASAVVIERCYIHDPLISSCAWFYSHPAGNEAVIMGSPDHSCVIRWCDFVGSDRKRFNDAVEGEGNFHERGGFNRDADVYGNFMVYCNDDCIELDGGQQNVRCFGNRFEGALCGVSVQGCMVSPVYVYDNDFPGMDDQMAKAGQSVKVSGFDPWRYHPVCYLLDNVFSGRGGVDTKAFRPRGVPEGNVFKDGALPPVSRPEYPKRPVPFLLDVTRLGGVEVRGGAVSPQTQTVTARWTGSADAAPVPFRVRLNDAFDWFAVSPSEGVIGPDNPVTFSVSYNAAKMNDRRFYRGAFLVQMTNGLSRVCSLVAATDFVPPFKAAKPGETAWYFDAFKPEKGTPRIQDDARGQAGRVVAVGKMRDALEYVFDIPKAGRYYLFVHGAVGGPDEPLDAHGYSSKLKVSVDGAPAEVSVQQAQKYMTWTMLTPGCTQGNMIKWYDWKPGRHTVAIRGETGGLLFDGLCATDAPGSFEPR